MAVREEEEEEEGRVQSTSYELKKLIMRANFCKETSR